MLSAFDLDKDRHAVEGDDQVDLALWRAMTPGDDHPAALEIDPGGAVLCGQAALVGHSAAPGALAATLVTAS